MLNTGGSLVISGVEPPGRFEWTPLYFKELRVIGSNAFGIEEVSNALDFHKTSVPLVTLVGGILGGGGSFLLQYWISAINYPLNVGGKPLFFLALMVSTS